jgi:hypothetical protein
MTAPAFLMRCPRCFGLHPWRAARYEAFTIERILPHHCQHGNVCTVDCLHGHPFGVGCQKHLPTCHGCGLDGCCRVEAEACAQCVETRAQVYARPLPRPECLVCREVKRQGGSGCPTFKTKKDGDWAVNVPDPLCRWRRLERVPPWCAGAEESERAVFLSAVPAEVRNKAIEEARRANAQVGAEQRHEKKTVEKKKKTDQTSLF